MQLDELATEIRARRLILSYSHAGYAKLSMRAPIPRELAAQIRARRRGLAALMRAGDWRLCPSPDLHRASWSYARPGRFVCGLCQRLDAELDARAETGGE